MYNNKIKKLLIIVLIIFITILNLNIKVFADGAGNGEGATTESLKAWDPAENPELYKPGEAPEETDLNQKAEVILGAINVIGVAISVITLMVLGIKYMIGSIEEKAEYKKTMTTYLIGAILVFSITTIPNILYQITKSINDL